jgi:hypothetical protein
MPQLAVLDRSNGRLRWDASSLLLSTMMLPDHAPLRKEYAAALRLQTAQGLPEGRELLTKQDHVLAGKFERRPRISQIMQTRRIHSVLAGALLWDLHTAATTHPDIATKNKMEFAIDRISIAQSKIGTRATIRSAWHQFQSVVHWCAALAYQWRVFGAPFPQNPESQYVGDVVISDFLALGNVFLSVARNYIHFSTGRRPVFWTAPNIPTIEPRRPGWPEAYALEQGFELTPAFLDAASRYVVVRDQLHRDYLISGPARRFEIARRSKNPLERST